MNGQLQCVRSECRQWFHLYGETQIRTSFSCHGPIEGMRWVRCSRCGHYGLQDCDKIAEVQAAGTVGLIDQIDEVTGEVMEAWDHYRAMYQLAEGPRPGLRIREVEPEPARFTAADVIEAHGMGILIEEETVGVR